MDESTIQSSNNDQTSPPATPPQPHCPVPTPLQQQQRLSTSARPSLLRRFSSPVEGEVPIRRLRRASTTRTISSADFLIRSSTFELATTLHGHCPECRHYHDGEAQVLRPRRYTPITCKACRHVIFGLGGTSSQAPRRPSPLLNNHVNNHQSPLILSEGDDSQRLCLSPRHTGLTETPDQDAAAAAAVAGSDKPHVESEAHVHAHGPAHANHILDESQQCERNMTCRSPSPYDEAAGEGADHARPPLQDLSLRTKNSRFRLFRTGAKHIFRLFGYDVKLTIMKRRKSTCQSHVEDRTKDASTAAQRAVQASRLLTPPPTEHIFQSHASTSGASQAGTLTPGTQLPTPPQGSPAVETPPSLHFTSEHQSKHLSNHLDKGKARADEPNACHCSAHCLCRLQNNSETGHVRQISLDGQAGSVVSISTQNSVNDALMLKCMFNYGSPSTQSLHSDRRDSGNDFSRRSTGQELGVIVHRLVMDDPQEGSSGTIRTWTDQDRMVWSAERPLVQLTPPTPLSPRVDTSSFDQHGQMHDPEDTEALLVAAQDVVPP